MDPRAADPGSATHAGRAGPATAPAATAATAATPAQRHPPRGPDGRRLGAAPRGRCRGHGERRQPELPRRPGHRRPTVGPADRPAGATRPRTARTWAARRFGRVVGRVVDDAGHAGADPGDLGRPVRRSASAGRRPPRRHSPCDARRRRRSLALPDGVGEVNGLAMSSDGASSSACPRPAIRARPRRRDGCRPLVPPRRQRPAGRGERDPRPGRAWPMPPTRTTCS